MMLMPLIHHQHHCQLRYHHWHRHRLQCPSIQKHDDEDGNWQRRGGGESPQQRSHTRLKYRSTTVQHRQEIYANGQLQIICLSSATQPQSITKKKNSNNARVTAWS
mmetsp:Transcript_24773/g.69563  ORF Transcript_24773/g.69563 Transcript_24773/m.69563 type:complete len:106 (-) Transcript_24773:246-563(-)